MLKINIHFVSSLPSPRYISSATKPETETEPELGVAVGVADSVGVVHLENTAVVVEAKAEMELVANTMLQAKSMVLHLIKGSKCQEEINSQLFLLLPYLFYLVVQKQVKGLNYFY